LLEAIAAGAGVANKLAADRRRIDANCPRDVGFAATTGPTCGGRTVPSRATGGLASMSASAAAFFDSGHHGHRRWPFPVLQKSRIFEFRQDACYIKRKSGFWARSPSFDRGDANGYFDRDAGNIRNFGDRRG
jgi:hypothetical protein